MSDGIMIKSIIKMTLNTVATHCPSNKNNATEATLNRLTNTSIAVRGTDTMLTPLITITQHAWEIILVYLAMVYGDI